MILSVTVRGDTALGDITVCTDGVAATTIASTVVTAIHHGLTAVR